MAKVFFSPPGRIKLKLETPELKLEEFELRHWHVDLFNDYKIIILLSRSISTIPSRSICLLGDFLIEVLVE